MRLLINKFRGIRSTQSDDPDSQPKLSLTEHLLSSAPDEYRLATQSPFLRLAARGRLPRSVLGRWLASERLYFHTYIRAAGRLLATLDLPRDAPAVDDATAVVKLVDWIIEDLVRIRDEERRMVDVAGRYGIALVPGGGPGGDGGPGLGPGPVNVDAGAVGGRVLGLGLTDGVSDGAGIGANAVSQPNVPAILPWLEAAIMFWGTERLFVDAWSWARAQQDVGGNDGLHAEEDADGGALRTEFIPTWSGDGLKEFVVRLQTIVDGAVEKEIEKGGEEAREEILRRTEGKWRSMVAGATEFWVRVDEV